MSLELGLKVSHGQIDDHGIVTRIYHIRISKLSKQTLFTLNTNVCAEIRFSLTIIVTSNSRYNS